MKIKSFFYYPRNSVFTRYLVLIFFIGQHSLFAQEIIPVSDNTVPLNIGKMVHILVDSEGTYDSSNIIFQNNFKKSNRTVQVFTLPVSSLWIRFGIKNLTRESNLYLSIKYPNISNILLFEENAQNKLILQRHTGNSKNFGSRGSTNVDFNFLLDIPYGQEKTYYINVHSSHPLELPLTINNYSTLNENNSKQDLIIGIYCGIILSTFLYNVFVAFATKDRSYTIYLLYLFCLGLAQLTFAGWAFKYFWPSHPAINNYIVVCTSCSAGIMGITFAKSFLRTDQYAPKINAILYFLIAFYIISILFSFSNYSFLAYLIINYNSLAGGITLLCLSIFILRKGYRPAYFYLLAWSFFLSAVIIYTLKNLNFLPTNTFTNYILYIGSSFEAILLSIALADKINTYKKEKESSQAHALKILRENETLIKEQNIILEQKVATRTDQLQKTNNQLRKALEDLKDTQIQLVEAEKMASLGQLTAGIAHEINNPINFVKSNIKPLKLDIDDLFEIIHDYNQLHNAKNDNLHGQLERVYEKEKALDMSFVKSEIQQLLKGIEDGAERTAEIVRGLKTFSRLDENELKTANVHDGIESTLVLLRNSLPPYIKIKKRFESKGNIECFPGKLNQVFMNILNNSIQAISEKKEINEEELITITTRDTSDKYMHISIKDTGPGMSEQVKHRIFEPFFTTKAVGEGTGLGMAIVFKIVEEHNGKIEVLSQPGKGAEFVITLPHVHPPSKN
jgi:two-component system, NtrC family, sensor kinase